MNYKLTLRIKHRLKTICYFLTTCNPFMDIYLSTILFCIKNKIKSEINEK